MRKVALALLVFAIINEIAVLFYSHEITLFIINAEAGCYPWSPRDVEFRRGMTICPGQTAHGQIRIEMPPKADDI